MEINNMHQIIKKIIQYTLHARYKITLDYNYWINLRESGIYSYPYPNIDFQISCQQAGLPKTRNPETPHQMPTHDSEF